MTISILPTFNDIPLGEQDGVSPFNLTNILVANVPQLLTVPTDQNGMTAKHALFSCSKTTAADFFVQTYTTTAQTADVGYDDTFAEWSTNGTFTTDTAWTKGAGWTIAAGVATATGAISTAISQTTPIVLVSGNTYTVTYTVTQSAGSIAVSLGGGTPGTSRSTSATFIETIVAGSTQILAFTGTGFTGTIDNVSVSGHTLGAGWTTASNVATAAGAISTAISNNAAIALVSGASYLVTFTITRSAGSLAVTLGGGSAGTGAALTGTYNQIITAGSTQVIALTGTGFTGTITAFAVRPCIALPSVTNTTGTGAALNPTGLLLNRNVVAIDIVSAGTPTVVTSFYK
jgi:hypothetical protein